MEDVIYDERAIEFYEKKHVDRPDLVYGRHVRGYDGRGNVVSGFPRGARRDRRQDSGEVIVEIENHRLPTGRSRRN